MKGNHKKAPEKRIDTVQIKLVRVKMMIFSDNFDAIAAFTANCDPSA